VDINVSAEQLRAIEAHGESTYPNEGAGFLLGAIQNNAVQVAHLLPIDNKREVEAQYNRYELNPQDFARAEMEADKRGLSLVGVFHSHPDHPAQPSQFDRDHAWPNFVYLITSIQKGKAEITTAWQLRGDRAAFDEDKIIVTEVSG
jgi:proteasome lid subunit RPN8/RPN11